MKNKFAAFAFFWLVFTTAVYPQSRTVNYNPSNGRVANPEGGVLDLTGITSVIFPANVSLLGQVIALNSAEVSGVLPSANGGAGTVNGLMKANGAGLTSAAEAGTDYLTPSGSGASLTGLTAGQVGFTQSEPGAVARTLQSRGDDWVSVKDFGAVGDNTADDTAAFQAAIDSRRHVYVPIGHYKITAEIVMNTLGQRITGESQTATIIRQATAAANGFMVGEQTDSQVNNGVGLIDETNYTGISNLTLSGPGKGTSTGYGITSTIVGSPTGWNNESFSHRNLIVQGWARGLDFYNGSSTWIEKCYLKSCNYGVYYRGTAATMHHALALTTSACDVGLYSGSTGQTTGYVSWSDTGANAIDAQIATSSKWTFVGGEMESQTNCVYHITDATVYLLGNTITAAGAMSSDAYVQVYGRSNVMVYNITAGGAAVGTPLAHLNTNTSRISGFTGCGYNFSDISVDNYHSDQVILQDGTKSRIGPFLITNGSQYTTITDKVRGAIFANFNSSNSGDIGDDVRMALKRSDGTYYWGSLIRNNYTRRAITGTSAAVGGYEQWLEFSNTSAVAISLPATTSTAMRATAENIVKITLKDSSGNAATNARTITPNGTDTIDGVNAAITIAQNYGWVTLATAGNGAWWIDSRGPWQPLDADLTDLADGSLTGSKVATATDTVQGAVELATDTETVTGTDTVRATTSAGVAAAIAASGAGATPTVITVADTADTTTFVGLFEEATGNLGPKTDAGLTYNATTGALTATGFVGPLTGNADTATNSTTVTVAATSDTTCSFLLSESETGNLPPKSDPGISYDANTNTLAVVNCTSVLTTTSNLTTTSGDTTIGAGGVAADGGGFKHGRITTGSIGAGATALVTLTWGTAFADTNYTVSAEVEDATTSSLSLSVVHVESKAAGSVSVRVLNNSVGSLTGVLNCIAVHD